MPLTPHNHDANRKRELERRSQDPASFGVRPKGKDDQNKKPAQKGEQR